MTGRNEMHAACEAMGVPWLMVDPGEDVQAGIREVCESIPPAYTSWIAEQFLTHRMPSQADAA